ncbi:MAG: AsmA family protein, partial [Victivallales bacterium]|nr:AsmA family protein [Victivallales bacterium]
MEKKKKKRKIWKILLGVLIFIVLTIAVAVMFLDHIIAGTMRSVGTKATGTKLAVESVSLSLLRGDLRINMMSIDNPDDYKEKQAFSFDLVHVDLDVSTLLSDTIIVNKIEIANVKIDYEPTLDGASNLNDIKDNIMKFIGAAKTEDKTDDKAEKEPKEEVESNTPQKEKKIIIESFVINKGTIMFSSNLIKTTIPIPLARIELNDIGRDS